MRFNRFSSLQQQHRALNNSVSPVCETFMWSPELCYTITEKMFSHARKKNVLIPRFALEANSTCPLEEINTDWHIIASVTTGVATGSRRVKPKDVRDRVSEASWAALLGDQCDNCDSLCSGGCGGSLRCLGLSLLHTHTHTHIEIFCGGVLCPDGIKKKVLRPGYNATFTYIWKYVVYTLSLYSQNIQTYNLW